MYGRILIVGDDRENVDSLAGRLRTKGYAVDTAYNQPNGLTSFFATQPDLVIADISDVEARRVLLGIVKERAREVRSERSLHAIDLSTQSQEEQGASMRAGATTAYRKPYDIGVLMERVDQLLDRPQE